jgi:hypothetical protein
LYKNFAIYGLCLSDKLVMPKVKVQKRMVKAKGKEYEQFWVALPKTLVESMKIEKGTDLEVFVERGDIILRRE